MINYNDIIKDSFDLFPECMKEDVTAVVDNFNIGNGVIKITIKQFNDCLAYMLQEGLNDH